MLATRPGADSPTESTSSSEPAPSSRERRSTLVQTELSRGVDAMRQTRGVEQGTWTSLINNYGDRLHAALGNRHHVASPLGAWLLLAMCTPLVEEDCPRELLDIVGEDPASAAHFA